MPLKGKPLSLFVYEKNSTFQNKAFKKIKAALNKKSNTAFGSFNYAC